MTRTLLMLLATAALLPAQADSGRRADSRLHLAIHIPAVLEMRLHDHPRTFVVGADDVERGYVVVSGAAIELVANHRQGVQLMASFPAGLVESVQIEGLDVPARFESSGAAVSMPRTSMAGSRMRRIEYRMQLAKSATAGTYAWPIRLALGKP